MCVLSSSLALLLYIFFIGLVIFFRSVSSSVLAGEDTVPVCPTLFCLSRSFLSPPSSPYSGFGNLSATGLLIAILAIVWIFVV